MRNLIKIGFLDFPENRWLDALHFFDYVYNIVFYDNEKNNLSNKKIISLSLISESDFFLKKILGRKIVQILITKKELDIFSYYILVFVLRILFFAKLRKYFKKLSYEICHSSYNDYDNSDLLTVIASPFIKTKITRCQKETRPEFSRKEIECFRVCDTIVLNNKENYLFFQQKYGKNIFDNKKCLFDIDEDWRKQNIWKKNNSILKLSTHDYIYHVVILTGVARSTPNNTRTGARQYYIPIVEELLSYGLKVHLHALHFEDDSSGVNQYKVIQNKNPHFHIHPFLDFVNDTENAYSELAKYDFGILHNFIEGESVSAFDRYNIPHRFYEYQLANVIPVVLRNQTFVLERLIEIENCGIILENYSELNEYKLSNSIKFLDLSFYDFIKRVYF
jgi:hypothetical protein